MKNRAIIMRRLEQIESNMSKLNFYLNNSAMKDNFIDTLNQTKELIDEAKSFIQQEPQSPGEINNF